MRGLFKTDREITPGPVPADVLAYWRGKGLQPSFSYKDVWNEEHDLAFSAAKVMRIDVLAALHDELDRAISKGIPFAQWQKEIEGRMQSLGWWAPHEVIDPKTGDKVKVDPPSRLRLIYDTNLRSARAVGQWNRIQKNKRARPYLLYQVGPSIHHREQHLAWHGLLLPVDDPFWTYAFPPNGHGCKCWIRTVSQREADGLTEIAAPEIDDKGKRTGGTVMVPIVRVAPPIDLQPWLNERTGRIELVPRGIGPGFHHPPGEGRRRALGMPSTPPQPPTPPAPPPAPAPAQPTPEPPASAILPTIKPLSDAVTAGVFTAQANRDGRMLVNVAKKIQKDLHKQYGLPVPLKVTKGEVFGPGHRHWRRAAGYVGIYPSGKVTLGLSMGDGDPVPTVVHEMVHTMGGVAGKTRGGVALAMEETSTETLALHFTGAANYLTLTRPPLADKPLDQRARGFERELAGRVQVSKGAYSPWRSRAAFAIALAEDNWDGAAVQRRLEEVALTWKRAKYETPEKAAEAFLDVLAPDPGDARDFYRAVLIDDDWGEP